MDLNKKLQEISDKVIEDKLPEIIETQVTKTLTGVVNDVFGTYSDFEKKLKEVVSAESNVSLEKCKLVDYSSLIIKAVESEIIKASIKPVELIADRIKDIVGFVDKKSIKLSELVDMYKSEIAENSSDDCGEITFVCEKSEQYKWHDVYFDEESDKEKRSCNIEFTVHEKGDVYNFRVSNFWGISNSNDPSAMSRFSKFELYLLRLINSGVKIEVDNDYPDLEWSKYEEY